MKSNSVLSALIKTLTDSETFNLVAARQLTLPELVAEQLPAVIITPGRQTQKMLIQGQADIEWSLTLSLYVLSGNGHSAQCTWFDLAASIGRLIANNRTLGGEVIDMQITGRSYDVNIYEPFASGTLDLTIRYRFNELTQGG